MACKNYSKLMVKLILYHACLCIHTPVVLITPFELPANQFINWWHYMCWLCVQPRGSISIPKYILTHIFPDYHPILHDHKPCFPLSNSFYFFYYTFCFMHTRLIYVCYKYFILLWNQTIEIIEQKHAIYTYLPIKHQFQPPSWFLPLTQPWCHHTLLCSPVWLMGS